MRAGTACDRRKGRGRPWCPDGLAADEPPGPPACTARRDHRRSPWFGLFALGLGTSLGRAARCSETRTSDKTTGTNDENNRRDEHLGSNLLEPIPRIAKVQLGADGRAHAQDICAKLAKDRDLRSPRARPLRCVVPPWGRLASINAQSMCCREGRWAPRTYCSKRDRSEQVAPLDECSCIPCRRGERSILPSGTRAGWVAR